eukprot:3453194-Rhodomonas_salina.5
MDVTSGGISGEDAAVKRTRVPSLFPSGGTIPPRQYQLSYYATRTRLYLNCSISLVAAYMMSVPGISYRIR